MTNELIIDIEQAMQGDLDNHQMEKLRSVLRYFLGDAVKSVQDAETNTNENLLTAFIASKRVEGCSNKSLRYYESTILNMFKAIGKSVKPLDNSGQQRQGGSYGIIYEHKKRQDAHHC
jgi:hypothetical protein